MPEGSSSKRREVGERQEARRGRGRGPCRFQRTGVHVVEVERVWSVEVRVEVVSRRQAEGAAGRRWWEEEGRGVGSSAVKGLLPELVSPSCSFLGYWAGAGVPTNRERVVEGRRAKRRKVELELTSEEGRASNGGDGRAKLVRSIVTAVSIGRSHADLSSLCSSRLELEGQERQG